MLKMSKHYTTINPASLKSKTDEKGYFVLLTFMANNLYQLNQWIKSSDLCFLMFDLVLYIPVNNFSVMSGQVFLG